MRSRPLPGGPGSKAAMWCIPGGAEDGSLLCEELLEGFVDEGGEGKAMEEEDDEGGRVVEGGKDGGTGEKERAVASTAVMML